MLIFLRPPAADKYNNTSTYEEPILSSFLGFLKFNELTLEYKIFDFFLDPNIQQNDFLLGENATYIIISREKGSIPHYCARLANLLLQKYKSTKVIIYGQISTTKVKLSKFIDERVKYVIHDEIKLAEEIGIKYSKDFSFENNGSHLPYYTNHKIAENKLKYFCATIETSRGCIFKCDFCFVNNDITFSKKWQIRQNDLIIKDMELYYKNGIRKFFFFDLEFLGSSKKFHEYRKELLRQISQRFPDIIIMIYCRADTLLKFNDYQLMKNAGIYNVYVGAESFYSDDLIALKKNVTSEELIKSIKLLLDFEINIFLSLILFNRNTTIESLEFNINVLEDLFKHKNAACLRIPAAFVNLEHSWDNKSLEKFKFSDKTYTKWTLYFTSQTTKGYAFNNKFEPLIEICRTLAYENERKITELNHRLDYTDKNTKKDIERWFANIDRFSLFIMKLFLNKFKNNLLTMNNILENLTIFFQMMELFNQKYLKDELPNLCTKEETFNMYKSDEMNIGDHGFDNVIPPLEAFLTYTKEGHFVDNTVVLNDIL